MARKKGKPFVDASSPSSPSGSEEVRITRSHLSDLRPQPEGVNARRHNPRNIGMIVDSLQEVGAARSLVIDENNDLMAGSGTWEAAGQAGIEDVIIVDAPGDTLVAVRRSGLSDVQKTRLALFDNRTQETSTWDRDVLLKLAHVDNGVLVEGMFRGAELALTLEALRDTTKALGHAGKGGDDYEPNLSGPTRSKPGDIWQIGPHRVMCGDARDETAMLKLMDGDKADTCWTDPPYGVDYTGKTRDALKIQGDTVSPATLRELLDSSFSVLRRIMNDGCPIYVAHPAGALSLVFDNAFVDAGFRLHQTLIWVKDSMVLGHSDHHFIHEPITFGYTPAPVGSGRVGRGGDHWYGPDNAVSVFSVPRPKRSSDHPTMKPVELIRRHLMNSSLPGSIVVDPFGGSGSTLVACHRTERIARICELDPVYVDVELDRAEEEGIGPIERVYSIEGMRPPIITSTVCDSRGM